MGTPGILLGSAIINLEKPNIFLEIPYLYLDYPNIKQRDMSNAGTKRFK